MDLDMSYERDQGLGHKEVVNVAACLADLTSGLVGMHDRSIDRVRVAGFHERLGWHVKVAIEDKWELPSPRDGCQTRLCLRKLVDGTFVLELSSLMRAN